MIMLGIVPGEGLLKKNPAILDTTKTIGKSGWYFSVLKWDFKKGGAVRHKSNLQVYFTIVASPITGQSGS